MDARRLRFCLKCKTQGSMDEQCKFTCLKCGTVHTSNNTAPRVFSKFSILAGRGGGKTFIGAHACREEMQVPNGIGWVMGATYKILHDSTFPTLVGLIPPAWVKKWNPEHEEITLINGHLIAFRSLDDPERARGPHGVCWGWIDEAAQAAERAYDVFRPTLIKAGGIVICTTTPLGFDWTYDKIEKIAFNAVQTKTFGKSWACKYWSEENPIFRESPVAMQDIEEARQTMTPEFFAQEYRAERHNAQGLIYDFKMLEAQYLGNAEAVRKLIPEWPAINPERPVLVGLDGGVNHPFGAVKIVLTEGGLVVVADYLRRMQAMSMQLPAIQSQFGLTPAMQKITWAANKNEANMRLEFGLKGISVLPAESKQEVGIQRVQSWLVTKQLWFAYTAPETVQQMRAYRNAPAIAADGQKRKEAVYKLNDELPDCFVAGTQIVTSRGPINIEHLKTGDLAWTRRGFKPITAVGSRVRDTREIRLSNGRIIRGTPTHPIWVDGKGFIPLRTLRYGDILWICTQTTTVPEPDPFGPPSTAPSRANITSTIATATRQTTISRIWSVYLRPFISGNTCWTGRLWNSTADSVQNFLLARIKGRGFVRASARQHGDGQKGWMTKFVRVRNAYAPSLSTGIPLPCIAPNLAPEQALTFGRMLLACVKSVAGGLWPITPQAGAVTVVGNEPAAPARVYNLSVDECPEYFANGVLVHNCLRYAVMAWPHLPDLEKPARTEKEQSRWDLLDESTQLDIERMQDYHKQERRGEMKDTEALYPMGEMYNGAQSDLAPW